MTLAQDLQAKILQATAWGGMTHMKQLIAKRTHTSRGAVDNWLIRGRIEERHHAAVIAFIAEPISPSLIAPPDAPVKVKKPAKYASLPNKPTADWRQWRPWFASDTDWINAMQLADKYQRKGWNNRAFRLRMNFDG